MPLTRAELQLLSWRKARRSIGNGDCVEIAPCDGRIAVRDSKDPAGSLLHYDFSAWKSFLTEARQGTFDRFS